MQAAGRTKGIKGADDAALGTKVVFIKAMLFETVHGWGSLALQARSAWKSDGIRGGGRRRMRHLGSRLIHNQCAGSLLAGNYS